MAELRSTAMQFKVGDRVVHPIYGIGHIANVEEKEFPERERCLYYQVALAKRTLWIPVEVQESVGLRLVTAKSDLDQYRQVLRSRPAPLEKNHHHRHLDLASRLKQNSFQIMCEVVRDLTAWGWRKSLGPTDTATLQKTRRNLHQEWAMAAGVSTTEAIKEINALLLATQHAFMK
jgi:RNA polymerase-interacting CarD/CdnL/TRCF family regulator